MHVYMHAHVVHKYLIFDQGFNFENIMQIRNVCLLWNCM